MASVNEAILVGNLGRDPKVRTFQGGGRVCSLSIATSNYWKDRESGECLERTGWHRVAIFSEPPVRVAENNLRKGRPVYGEGRLETRKWTDRDGGERNSTEVELRPFRGELQLPGSRDGSPDSEISPGGHDGGYEPSQDDGITDLSM